MWIVEKPVQKAVDLNVERLMHRKKRLTGFFDPNLSTVIAKQKHLVKLN